MSLSFFGKKKEKAEEHEPIQYNIGELAERIKIKYEGKLDYAYVDDNGNINIKFNCNIIRTTKEWCNYKLFDQLVAGWLEADTDSLSKVYDIKIISANQCILQF